MTVLSRRGMFASLALASGCALVLSPALAQVQIQVVPVEPPPPRVEVVPVIPMERREAEFWQPGYWRWNGQGHEWVEGRYVVRPRTGATWAPGRWERRGPGWVYVEGGWQ